MITKYRLDGSPYPETEEGLIEWAMDMQDSRGRVVRQEELWNGLWISTVWTGLPSALSIMYAPRSIRQDGDATVIEDAELLGVSGIPAAHGTFETMVFDNLAGGEIVDGWKWSALDEAERGHYSVRKVVASVRFTLGYWWYLLRRQSRPPEEDTVW